MSTATKAKEMLEEYIATAKPDKILHAFALGFVAGLQSTATWSPEDLFELAVRLAEKLDSA